MNTIRSRLAVFTLILAFGAIGGCGGGSSGSSSNSTGGTSGGAFTLSVSDTPADDATAVVITFSGVEFHGANGVKTFNFASPRSINLMQYQHGRAATLLNGVSLPAGAYDWAGIHVNAAGSYMMMRNGTQHGMTMHGGDDSWFTIMHGFTVAPGAQMRFNIDFDLRQSLFTYTGMGGMMGYMFQPMMHMQNYADVGAIQGAAENTMMIGGLAISDPTCDPALYMFSGSNVTPVDIDTSATGSPQPIETGTLALNTQTGRYDYMVGFLPPGQYTMAVTCAGLDTPDQTDNLAFSAPHHATVTAGGTETIDFP